jgi:hypothetical protein
MPGPFSRCPWLVCPFPERPLSLRRAGAYPVRLVSLLIGQLTALSVNGR